MSLSEQLPMSTARATRFWQTPADCPTTTRSTVSRSASKKPLLSATKKAASESVFPTAPIVTFFGSVLIWPAASGGGGAPVRGTHAASTTARAATADTGITTRRTRQISILVTQADAHRAGRLYLLA